MDFGIKGKTALVCAASKGLGRACAEELAREGADLSICARGEDALRATQKELEELGGRVLATPLDMVEPRTCERFIDETVSAYGRLDIVVNVKATAAEAEFQHFRDDLSRALRRIAKESAI